MLNFKEELNSIEDYAFSHFSPIENLFPILESGYIIPSKDTKHKNYGVFNSTFFGFLTPSNNYYITDFDENNCIFIFDPIIYYKYKGILSNSWNFGVSDNSTSIFYSEPKEIKHLSFEEKLRLNLNYADIFIGAGDDDISSNIFFKHQNNPNEYYIQDRKVSLKYLKYIIVSDNNLKQSFKIFSEESKFSRSILYEKYKELGTLFLSFSQIKELKNNVPNLNNFPYLNIDYLYNDLGTSYSKTMNLYNSLIFK